VVLVLKQCIVFMGTHRESWNY